MLGVRKIYYTVGDGYYVGCRVDELDQDHCSIANRNVKNRY
jgi:hypothetical protein